MAVKDILINFVQDLRSLFFPELCLVCSTSLIQDDHFVCAKCISALPKTHFHLDDENQAAKVFWGRVNLKNVTSAYYFRKNSPVQTIVHELKYRGKKELGHYFGQILAHDLKKSENWNNFDFVVPVPLHKRRLLKRGYNQSEWLSKGIAEVLEKPLKTDILVRDKYNLTQTKKDKAQRWENVEGIFSVEKGVDLSNKNILLVDDIVTTGSTIESCVNALNKAGCTSISLATLGFASG